MERKNTPAVIEEIEEIQPKEKDLFVTFKQILLGLVVLFFIVFMVLNFKQVEVNLLFAQIQAPLVIILLLCYMAGSLVTWLMGALKKPKNK